MSHDQHPHHTFMYLWIMGALVVLVAGMAVYALQHPRQPVVAPTPTSVATSTKPSESVTTDTSGVFTLALGETGSSHGWSITPIGVLEDSRCPTDVECIQAGTVRLSVRIGTTSFEQTLTLLSPTTIPGGTMTLVKVTPEPSTAKPIQKRDYRFSLLVVKN